MYNQKPPRKRTYTSASGAAKRPAKQAAPSARRLSRRRAQMMIRRVIILGLVAAAALLAVYGVMRIPRGQPGPAAIAMSPDDPCAPFGGGLLYLSGGQLSYVSSAGAARTLLPLGEDGMFYASGQYIAAWRGVQLYVLNANGDILYNDRMDTPIQFARIGASYAAALTVGADGSRTINVITHTGTPVWSIDAGANDYLDMRFFGTQDLRLMTVGLDAAGASPSSLVTTYEPRRYEVTDSGTLHGRIVYKAYQRGNNLIMVDAASVTAYDYRGVASSSIPPVTVYGWQARDIRTAGSDTLALFTPVSQSDGTLTQARIISSGGDTELRTPSACIDIRLGSRGVYAFTANTVYAARYGSASFAAHTLSAAIDRVICVLDGDRVVAASGGDVFIMTLPTL